MKCGACGTELERDAKFCHICGQPAPAQEPETGGYCPRCGARLPKLSVFCPQCGVALSDAAPRPEAKPAAAKPAPAARAAAPVPPAEHPPAPKKEKKKSKRAPIGGILLAILILALIFGCLGAVLYVEATMRGQTMKEYVAAFVRGEPEPGEARWSDLEKPEASAAPAPASEQNDSSRDGVLTKDVCSIYLNLLQSRQADIERYDWQQLGTDLPTRQVVLCDVCGDILPELIWVEAAEDENVTAATLNIAGIRDGEAVILSSQRWDVQAGGGFHYYLFQEEDGKTLYAFTVSGEETWTQRYSIYPERDGGLAAEELLTFITAWDPESGEETRSYAKEGGEISEEEWLGAVGSLQAGTKGVLMYSSHAGDFLENYVSQNGCPAMTCAGAILLLTECLEAVS